MLVSMDYDQSGANRKEEKRSRSIPDVFVVLLLGVMPIGFLLARLTTERFPAPFPTAKRYLFGASEGEC